MRAIGYLFQAKDNEQGLDLTIESPYGSGTDFSGDFRDVDLKYIRVGAGTNARVRRTGRLLPENLINPELRIDGLTITWQATVGVENHQAGATSIVGFWRYHDDTDEDTRTGFGFRATDDGFWAWEVLTSQNVWDASNIARFRYGKSNVPVGQLNRLKMILDGQTGTLTFYINDAIVDWITTNEGLGGWGAGEALRLEYRVANSPSGDLSMYYGADGTPELVLGIPSGLTLASGSIDKPTTNVLSFTDVYVRLGGSEYVPRGEAGDHQFTEWLIATDSDFTNIVVDSRWDAFQLVTFETAELTASTTYYAKHRYRSENCITSPFSDPVMFTTLAPDPNRDPSTPWTGDPCDDRTPPPPTAWTRGNC